MLTKDFKEFIASLNEHGVEFLIVGGYAVIAHGHPRYTGDLDIWVGRSGSNLERLNQALNTFGLGMVDAKADLERAADSFIRLGRPPYQIDILGEIDGVTFQECYARRVMTDFGGASLPLIGLDDLKRNKRASGRHQDLADVEKLGG